MKHQKVVVNVWKMIFSSCSYLALAFLVWLFLKLAYACFWFPKYLQSQQDEAEEEEKQLLTTENEMVKLDKDESIEQTIEDKKTI